jgi:hypothetical protein
VGKQTLYQRGGAVRNGKKMAIFAVVFHKMSSSRGNDRFIRRQRLSKKRAEGGGGKS